MKWRVWYRNCSVPVANFEEWKALPDGIEGVVEYEDTLSPDGYPTRVLITGGDWYWWCEGRIVTDGPNYFKGTWVDRPLNVCSVCLKRSGDWLPDDEWNTIRALMLEHRTWR